MSHGKIRDRHAAYPRIVLLKQLIVLLQVVLLVVVQEEEEVRFEVFLP